MATVTMIDKAVEAVASTYLNSIRDHFRMKFGKGLHIQSSTFGDYTYKDSLGADLTEEQEMWLRGFEQGFASYRVELLRHQREQQTRRR